jgi:hypothetical protein
MLPRKNETEIWRASVDSIINKIGTPTDMKKGSAVHCKSWRASKKRRGTLKKKA